MKCTQHLGDGVTCQAEALTDSDLCFMHDSRPAVAEKRQEARSLGGSARRTSVRGAPVTVDVSSPEGILESLRAVGQSLADGDADRSTANSLSYILATATAATKLISHEKRIRRLEVKLGLREAEADA